MWDVQPIIFEEENEEALKSNFVRLCALYPEHSIFEIASSVFRYCRDPEMRSQQAAMIWSKDIEVLERIRKARLNNGENAPEVLTKNELLLQMRVILEDKFASHKDKIAAGRLIAEIQGVIVKAIDKKITDGNVRVRPAINIVRSSDKAKQLEEVEHNGTLK